MACSSRTAYRSPLTAYRSPLTAYRLPLTAYRLPLTAHRCYPIRPCIYTIRRIYVPPHGPAPLGHRAPAHRGGAHPAPHPQLPRGRAAVRLRPAGRAGSPAADRVAAPPGAAQGGPRSRHPDRPVRPLPPAPGSRRSGPAPLGHPRRRRPRRRRDARRAGRRGGTQPVAHQDPGGEDLMTHRILVVDDEPDITALVAYHLAKAGFRVSTANTGPDALKAAREERPDIVILALMLPGVSGYDVLTELRKRDETKDVGVILLTARREETDRIRGLSLGADDYLTKPFSPHELALRVSALLRRLGAPAVAAGSTTTAGPITIDRSAHKVSV